MRGGKRPGAGRKPRTLEALNRAEDLLDKQRRAWKVGISKLADQFEVLVERMLARALAQGLCPSCQKPVPGYQMDTDMAKFLVEKFSRAIGADPGAMELPITGVARFLKELMSGKAEHDSPPRDSGVAPTDG